MTKRLGVAAAVCVAVLALTGCGQSGGSTTGQAPGGSGNGSGIDTYVAADQQFYGWLRPGAAILTRPPASIKDAATEATAVVLAKVAKVEPLRQINGLQTAGVHLQVSKVVRGKLRAELGDSVVVEFLIGDPQGAVDQIGTMGKQMPQGEAVWLLRWQGEPPAVTKPDMPKSTVADPKLYSLIHLEAGIFSQGDKSVINPSRETDAGEPEGAMAESKRYAKLSDLVKYIESIN